MSFYRLPPALGGFTDTGFGGGRRSYGDIGKFTPMPLYGEGALSTGYMAQQQGKGKGTPPYNPNSGYSGEDPLGGIEDWAARVAALKQVTIPLNVYEQRVMGDVAGEQAINQARQLYPLLSAAGRESTERALSASQRFRAFAEGLPSNVQAIMASKQAQRQSAQSGEADLMRAVAAQQQASTQGASIAPYYGQVRSA
jgi:hypothetical protein